MSNTHLRFIVGLIAFCATIESFALTHTVDGIKWTYTVSYRGASIGGGSSFSRAVQTSTSGAVTIPSTLSGWPVTSIGNYAFSDCTGLTCVTIPDCVTSIGSHAFNVCRGLTSLTIPGSVTNIGESAFAACSGLTSVTIPNSVTHIETHAFNGCRGLASIMIPDSVTSIGSRAFASCSGLTSVTIPDSVTSIGSCAFYGCAGLTSMTIPDGVTSIGDSAFYDCTGLTSMMIPDSVTSMGTSVFQGCRNITSVTVPQYVCTKRLADIFQWYSALTNVVICEGVSNVGDYMFLNCKGVKSVTIPDSVTNIGASAFQNCTSLASIIIPDSVTNIGNNALRGCTALKTVTIPNEVQNIGIGLFYNDTALTNVLMHSSITNIGSSAFYGCVALSNITIPEMVEKIGSSAFYNCTSLTNVMFEGDAPTSVGNNAFLGISQDCHGWVHRASTGWKITLPGRWNNIWLDYIHYVVTFNANGGTCATESLSVAEGAAIGDLPVPMKMNYEFAGWFTEPEGGSKILSTTKVSRETTLYAHWETAALTYDEALDVGEGVAIATDAAIPWRPILDAAAKVGGATARSGAVGDRESTWLSATVSGAGTMSFWCKVSCEHDEDGMFTWDRLMVYTNDVEIVEWRMDGETGWVERTLSFDGGANTVKWVYYKDKSDSNGQDCAWVDAVTWRSDGGDVVVDFGEDKSMVVSGEWIAEHETYIRSKGDDTVLALKSKAANGRLSIADCYLLGIDPEEPTEDFKITSFPMKADGSPDFDAIIFSPPQAKWNFQGAVPKLKGKANLNDQWQDVPSGGNPSFRFFTIVVELP